MQIESQGGRVFKYSLRRALEFSVHPFVLRKIVIHELDWSC